MLIPKEESGSYERVQLGALSDTRSSAAQRKAGKSTTPASPEQELERAANKAKETGYNAGYKEGAARAAAEAQKLAALATAAQQCLNQQGEQMAAEILDLALELARQMVRTELQVRRETLIAIVREAIDCLPHGTQGAQLILNPADTNLVREHIGDELKASSFRVVEDHRIQPGGCKIASSVCEVDATLATRWKRIVATLGLDHNWMDLDSK
ncbi:MAG TPA: flagellar assembly protein FliH [Burkholderiales bacterium]|nr:flagellar assembly protein FliH [Burkholderiales bacterium]